MDHLQSSHSISWTILWRKTEQKMTFINYKPLATMKTTLKKKMIEVQTLKNMQTWKSLEFELKTQTRNILRKWEENRSSMMKYFIHDAALNAGKWKKAKLVRLKNWLLGKGKNSYRRTIKRKLDSCSSDGRKRKRI